MDNTQRLADWIAKHGRERWLDAVSKNEISPAWLVLKHKAINEGRYYEKNNT